MKEVIFASLLFLVIPLAYAQDYPEYNVTVQTVAKNLTIPWSVDWTPDGTMLFTERDGHLRVVKDGQLLEDPLLSLGVGGIEGGMLGIAVDPNYLENNYIYIY